MAKEQYKPVSEEPVRLNKYLSDAGVCSRRQADRYVEAGRITVAGQPALMGQKVVPGQCICLDGTEITVSRKRIILAVNKPRGIVCTTEKREKDNIVDFIGYPERIYPMGRLDKDSEGLILMTNDGELMDQILRARNYHEKEYLVRVNKPVTMDFLKQMREGVPILDTVTRPCQVEKTSPYMFRIVLTQGLNRQIRRMCEALDYRVRWLKRVRIMNINLDQLPVGEYREISGRELEELERLLEDKTAHQSNRYRNSNNRNSREKINGAPVSGIESIGRAEKSGNYSRKKDPDKAKKAPPERIEDTIDKENKNSNRKKEDYDKRHNDSAQRKKKYSRYEKDNNISRQARHRRRPDE